MSDVMNVSAGKPKIGGAIFRAPVGTALPTDTVSELNEAFKALGYCSEDGLTNANTMATEKVKAWGGDIVLTPMTEKTDTFKFKLLEIMNDEVLKAVHGDDNVTGTLATGITVNVNAAEQKPHSWVADLALKDGAVKRIVIPNAAVSEVAEVVYKDNDAVGYEVTIAATPDSAGNTHYEYLKKGA